MIVNHGIETRGRAHRVIGRRFYDGDAERKSPSLSCRGSVCATRMLAFRKRCPSEEEPVASSSLTLGSLARFRSHRGIGIIKSKAPFPSVPRDTAPFLNWNQKTRSTNFSRNTEKFLSPKSPLNNQRPKRSTDLQAIK